MHLELQILEQLLQKQLISVNIDSSDNIYKILISDGYVNVGVVGVPQIKQDYKNFYNACIGIGNETDYDKSLLQH